MIKQNMQKNSFGSCRIRTYDQWYQIVFRSIKSNQTYHYLLNIGLRSWSPKLVFRRQVHPAEQYDPKNEKSDNSDAHNKMEISPRSGFFLVLISFTRIAQGIIIEFGGGAARHCRDHGGVAIWISKRMLTYDGDWRHFRSNFGLIVFGGFMPRYENIITV